MSKDDLQKNFKKSDLGKSSIQSVKAFTFKEKQSLRTLAFLQMLGFGDSSVYLNPTT